MDAVSRATGLGWAALSVMTATNTVSGLPRPSGEARARAELKAAQERLGHLVDNLATAERAAARASELAWDREHDIEAREAAAKKRRSGVSDGDEKALVESILVDGVAPIEKKEPPDPELERLRTRGRRFARRGCEVEGPFTGATRGRPGVALDHELLDPDRAFDRGDHRRKLDQQPVASRLDDAPAPARHKRLRRFTMLTHRPRRPHLVLAHEARVADHVGGEDRGELAGFGHRVPQDRAYLSMRQCTTRGRFGSIWPVLRAVQIRPLFARSFRRAGGHAAASSRSGVCVFSVCLNGGREPQRRLAAHAADGGKP